MAKKIEGLLPVDPIGALNKIKDNYLRYFETAFKFEERYPGDDLDKRKNAEMRRNNNLFHEQPYCEIIPEYISDDEPLAGLIDHLPAPQRDLFPSGFADFIKCGLMDYSPYRHQFEALVSAFIEGKNTVITSGTGSGKTESFLLPLLASLFKELSGWPNQNYNMSWYAPQNTGGQYDNAYQRAGENIKRPASIRALIMYPMNALVEDQIARLRKAIDGDKVRQYFDSDFGHNRIFFGQYNSSTIGRKSINGVSQATDNDKIECLKALSEYSGNYKRLLQRKKELVAKKDKLSNENLGEITDDRRKEIEKELLSFKKELSLIEDAWYIAPRLDPNSFSGEMVTRWDMQDKAPDILITNFSMLSAMLMRSSEHKMFEDSRRWFQVKTDSDSNLTEEQRRDEKKKRVFHLILDELHLYRGTAGTEVAYLIRTFLNEIGVPPVIEDDHGIKRPNEQLRIIASSASLDDPQDFLKQFFGVYDEADPERELFNIIRGADYVPSDTGLDLDYSLFSTFAKTDEDGGIVYIDKPDSRDEIRQQFITSLNDPDVQTLTDFVDKYREKIFYDFKRVTKLSEDNDNSNCRYVPRSLMDYAKILFNDNYDALRGFFIFRADPEIKDQKLPRFRFHQFFKYVEGLWGELTESEHNGHQQVIGDVMYAPQEVVRRDNSQHKVLELLRCECCGELFIGGNRKKTDHDNCYMTLNYPELNRIPNRNPTPMVQNKHYPEYAIFWPHEEEKTIDAFPAIDSKGAYSSVTTGFRGRWQRAYLNPTDGKMELSILGRGHQGWIKGYVYILERCNNNGDEDKMMALPCTCPHCNKDYSYRRYTKSPIRSFRSGISRSNQIICKELFYQLPLDNKKLIGFSDSRQDAAEQASDIAQEHYRDMVRLFFLECVSEPPKDNLEKLKKLVKTLIQVGEDINDIRTTIDNYRGVDLRHKQLLSFFAQNGDIGSINQLHNENGVIRLDDLVSSGNQVLGGRLVKKLLKVGINPAGPEYADQTINGHHWSCAYNFGSFTANSTMGTPVAMNVRDRLTAAIFHNSFGEFFKSSSEDIGLGYLGLLHFAENDQNYQTLRGILDTIGIDVKEFLNAYIRVLGDRYRYRDPDSIRPINNHDPDPNYNNDWVSYSSPHYASSCKKHIETITDLLNNAGIQITKDQLGDLVFNTLEACGIRMAELTLDSLGFYTILNSATTRYFKCPKCHRVHLHWGMGVCTNTACRTPLDRNQGGLVQDLYEENFIAYDLTKERRTGCRIHTEELSGQTDDQASRLLEFKGIILDNPDLAISREIDMINVTTTMEVGVDIGGLLAVFQGNMPPTRYNYQQRVGRGGRRGQPFSTAITFCRGKSHDTYYYKEAADEMLGGVPAQPKLSIRPVVVDNKVFFNVEIVKRVILKQILHMAMAGYVSNENDIDPLDVSGEFGLVEDWAARVKPHLIQWLDNHQFEVNTTIHYYLDQYNRDNIMNNIIDGVIEWYYDAGSGASDSACINAIDNAIKVANCRGIGQCLTEAGLLPLYGMPSNSRVLYHGKKGSEYRTIDRPVEQSITEFAPGSIKTKDHGFYTAAGLTTNFKMSKYETRTDGNGRKYVHYDDRRWDVFEFCHRLTKDPNTGKVLAIEQQIETISDIEDNNDIPIIIPKAYRTNLITYNEGRKSDNNDKSNYCQATIWADANLANNVKHEILPNANVKYWTCGGDSKPTVWFINDNNGKLFTGERFFLTERIRRRNIDHYYVSDDSPKHISGNVDSVLDDITVYPSFLIEEPKLSRNNVSCHKEQINGQTVSHSIALAAKKVTEMICITVRNVNTRLNLSVGGQAPGYEPAIISAFYSAATLIQRAFADELDIQPDEIDISEIKIENGFPSIYMSDALANGSGYVGMLMEKVEGNKTRLQILLEKIIGFNGTYLSSILNHKDVCKSSCPKCIRTYQNAGYHHVLDWRLGVDLIKLMLDDQYDMGFSDLDDTPYGDLREQIITAGNSVADNNPLVELKKLPDGGYYLSSRRLIPPAMEKLERIVHPLWNHDPYADQNFFELLRTGYIQKDNARQIAISNTMPSNSNVTFHL